MNTEYRKRIASNYSAIVGGICVIILIGCSEKEGLSVEDVSTHVEYLGFSNETLASPLKDYTFHLKIHNQSKNAKWYLWVERKDDGLTGNSKFLASAPWDPETISILAVDCTKLQGVETMVTLRFLGIDAKNSFFAIYVPADGTFEDRNFVVNSFGDRNTFSLYKLKFLHVNGSIPLQDWLPEQVINSKNVLIDAPRLDMQAPSNSALLPKLEHASVETLKNVQFKLEDTYKVQIK